MEDDELIDDIFSEDQVLFDKIEYYIMTAYKYSVLLESDYMGHIDVSKYNRFNDDLDYELSTLSTEEETVKDFKQWVKVEAGEMATNGLQGFINTVDKLGSFIGTMTKKFVVKWKLRKITPEYLDKAFDGYLDTISNARRYDKFIVDVVPYEILLNRLEGYHTIVQEIVRMAESADESAFDSDSTWERFASASNRAIGVRPPKPGTFFRELVWIKPYHKRIDLMKSDWGNPSNIHKLKLLIIKIKESVFDELQQAMENLKRTLKGMTAEVSHTRLDNHRAMVVKYARSYVATKFLYQLQDMFVKELLFASKTVPKALSKINKGLLNRESKVNKDEMDRIRDNDEKKKEEMKRETASNAGLSKSSEELYEMLSTEAITLNPLKWIEAVKEAHKRKQENDDYVSYEKHRNDMFDKYQQLVAHVADADHSIDTINTPSIIHITSVLFNLQKCMNAILSFNPFRSSSKIVLINTLNKVSRSLFYDAKKHKFIVLQDKEQEFIGSGWDNAQTVGNLRRAVTEVDSSFYELYAVYHAVCTKFKSYIDGRIWDDKTRITKTEIVKDYLKHIDLFQKQEKIYVQKVFSAINSIYKAK